MPRAIWTGTITFGLVNVPVRLYRAVQEHKLRFHYVHEKDSSPIGYQKVCKKEDKPVPDKEIVKAFESKKGEYVFMEDEDFTAAKVEGYKTIDIVDSSPTRTSTDLLREDVLRGPWGSRGGEGLLVAREGDGAESELTGIATPTSAPRSRTRAPRSWSAAARPSCGARARGAGSSSPRRPRACAPEAPRRSGCRRRRGTR